MWQRWMGVGHCSCCTGSSYSICGFGSEKSLIQGTIRPECPPRLESVLPSLVHGLSATYSHLGTASMTVGLSASSCCNLYIVLLVANELLSRLSSYLSTFRGDICIIAVSLIQLAHAGHAWQCRPGKVDSQGPRCSAAAILALLRVHMQSQVAYSQNTLVSDWQGARAGT